MKMQDKTPELLAPAGDPDSGYAALEYGADALYLGMNRFSARAEAANFSPDELSDLVGYAHGLTPRRNIYLTLNTLVQQAELPDAAAVLFAAAECGVDAVIVQDLGIVKLLQDRFPSLRIHASTQMAIHSLEGALAAKKLGCSRVTLARELTLSEIEYIVDGVGSELEVETFIHGTLCYSYSGLCLFSSVQSGRSGNRGRCIYSCREAADTHLGRKHPFSLKDLALGEKVLDLARIGVTSLKIEGRKKNPLYVAATVDHYRRILDGKLFGPGIAENAARLQTIFARLWTTFFIDSKRNPDAVDPEAVGHRGSRIGSIDRVVRTPAGKGIAFSSTLPIERHDGLQVDLPGEARPLGFAVDKLFLVRGGRLESVFEAPSGANLAVPLPEDAPVLSPGLPLYLASSQAVKRAFPFSRPKAGSSAQKLGISVEIDVMGENEARATVSCKATLNVPAFWLDAGGEGISLPLACCFEERLAAYEARDAAGPEKAARAAFERLGDSRFRLVEWRFTNPSGLFIKPGEWNRLRRHVAAYLEASLEKKRNDLFLETAMELVPAVPTARANGGGGDLAWSIYTDKAEYLAAFTDEDFARCDEVAINIGYGGAKEIVKAVAGLSDRIGAEKIRLGLPLILRKDAVPAVMESCAALYEAGWRRWLVSGLGGWQLIRHQAGIDLAADWTLYGLNSQAIENLGKMGFTSFTLSPEDDSGNMERLSAAFDGRLSVVVFSHLPLFISAVCAHAHMGLCGKQGDGCRQSDAVLRMTMERGARVEVIPQRCGSVVVEENYYSLATHLGKISSMGVKNLRAEFRWRNYLPDEVVDIWRRVRSGTLPEKINANFTSKML